MRYFSILDGMSLTNEDTAGDPQFFGYQRPGGSWLIMKYDVAGGTYTFKLGSTYATYANIWTNRATEDYEEAGTLPKL